MKMKQGQLKLGGAQMNPFGYARAKGVMPTPSKKFRENPRTRLLQMADVVLSTQFNPNHPGKPGAYK